MNAQKFLYLSRKDVEAVKLPMREIISALEIMFKEKGHGRVEMPPKPGIHTRPDSFIHAMPAFIPALGSAGLKWVSGYPENQKKGLWYINGLLVLNDPETGIPLSVMDCTWITAQRTGAATALAARYLARPESKTLGILACGVQGRSHVEALACEFKISKINAYDVVAEVAQRFATDISKQYQVEVEIVDHPKKAVTGMDLVVTSGPILKNPQPIIESGWLSPGAFASPVDFDSYWTGAALQESNKIATDDVEQMNYYRKVGYFQKTPQPYADLGELVCGTKPGRQTQDEKTFAINLGIALEDMATAPLIFKRARDLNLGHWLEL